MNLESVVYTLLVIVLPVVITLIKGWLQKQSIVKRYNLNDELEIAANLAIAYAEAWGKQLEISPESAAKLEKAIQYINDNYKQLNKLSDDVIKAHIESKLK